MTSKLKKQLLEEYRNIFINSFEAGGGYGFRFYHGVRMMRYCEAFLRLPSFKHIKINRDALAIAALFADVGKVRAINKRGELVYGSKGDREHAKSGALLVSWYISKYLKDKKLMNFIQEIIREQQGIRQMTIESKLVKDADRLDNYGFIQIWRHITYAHYDKRNIDRLNEFWIKEAWRRKAKDYLKKFNFPIIKKIAMERFKKLDYLLKEINKEMNGMDIDKFI